MLWNRLPLVLLVATAFCSIGCARARRGQATAAGTSLKGMLWTVEEDEEPGVALFQADQAAVRVHNRDMPLLF